MSFVYPRRDNGEGYRWLVLCKPDGSLLAWTNLPNHEPHARALAIAILGDSSLPGICYVNHEKPTRQEYQWQPVAPPKSRPRNSSPFPPDQELMKLPALKKSTPASKKPSTTPRSRKTKSPG